MNQYTIAFDVGGHFIKAVVLRNNGEVCEETFSIYSANSQDSREQLLNHFVNLIQHQASKIMDNFFKIIGIGYAFPGPFDYQNGISYVKGVQKFDNLYGVNLKTEIRERILESNNLVSKFIQDFPIVFDNDANLFALGEQLTGKASRFTRAICITIGTGIGSAFVERGQLVKHRPGVPTDGWIYSDAFRDSIVDDFISKRGVLRIAREVGIDEGLDVREIANLARLGDVNAQRVFYYFGETLGEMLNRYIDSFKPEGVVIGGQIAKSYDLFMPGLSRTLADSQVIIEFSEDTSRSTFVGLSILLQQK